MLYCVYGMNKSIQYSSVEDKSTSIYMIYVCMYVQSVECARIVLWLILVQPIRGHTAMDIQAFPILIDKIILKRMATHIIVGTIYCLLCIGFYNGDSIYSSFIYRLPINSRICNTFLYRLKNYDHTFMHIYYICIYIYIKRLITL